MSLRLQAVKFNYDTESSSRGALNIRRNAGRIVPIPEWQFGVSFKPEDSPAAYSIRDSKGQPISIQVQVCSSDPELAQVEIRAIDPAFTRESSSWFKKIVFGVVRIFCRSFLGNVLGEVRARRVSFTSGCVSGFETCVLQNVAIASRGIGIYTTTWRWQYRGCCGKWIDFQTSRHQIYVVAGAPTLPWRQLPYEENNIQMPWTDVLDYACQWAEGAKSVDDASARVTEGVNRLGGSIITYDCASGGGRTHYCDDSGSKFYCSRFLGRLRGDYKCSSFYVNCVDCAAIVSTFSNILGADLSLSDMEAEDGGPFYLNPVLLIGSLIWQPCVKSFVFHKLAWKGACGESDDVFDACIQVDGDEDPASYPHLPLLPVNIKFAAAGGLLYRDRLVSPADRSRCRPLRDPQRLNVC